MGEHSLLFFAAINSQYTQFVLPFIYFAAKYNPNCSFEILFTEKVPTYIQNSIPFLKKNLNINEILFRTINSKILPQKLRFLEKPKTQSTYIYISDIDILICEPILNFHKEKLIDKCYHNVTRVYSKHHDFMSGLHFAHISWYNKTEKIRNEFMKETSEECNDEKMLYLITQKSNIFIDNSLGKDLQTFNKNRPQHGVHMSLKRKPFDTNSIMTNMIPGEYKTEFLSTIHDKPFQYILNIDKEFSTKLQQLLEFHKLK